MHIILLEPTNSDEKNICLAERRSFIVPFHDMTVITRYKCLLICNYLPGIESPLYENLFTLFRSVINNYR